MDLNVGFADRLIRQLIGVALVALYVIGIVSGIAAVFAMIFAAGFVLSGTIGFCPLYHFLGVKSCEK